MKKRGKYSESTFQRVHEVKRELQEDNFKLGKFKCF